VHDTSTNAVLSYLNGVAINDEIAAELTAMAMGWEPVEREDGTTIWVRSEDIGVDGAPYCDTALEVVRSYTH
jgi:hypothetical protein